MKLTKLGSLRSLTWLLAPALAACTAWDAPVPEPDYRLPDAEPSDDFIPSYGSAGGGAVPFIPPLGAAGDSVSGGGGAAGAAVGGAAGMPMGGAGPDRRDAAAAASVIEPGDAGPNTDELPDAGGAP